MKVLIYIAGIALTVMGIALGQIFGDQQPGKTLAIGTFDSMSAQQKLELESVEQIESFLRIVGPSVDGPGHYHKDSQPMKMSQLSDTEFDF